MKKKFISLLTAAAMVFAALPVVAENADSETEEVTAIEEVSEPAAETVPVDVEAESANEEYASESEEVLPTEETTDELVVEDETAETEEILLLEEEQSVEVLSADVELLATSGTCGDDLTWTFEDGVLTISGTGDMKDYSSYSYVPWYSSCSSITGVIISDEVTSISSYAFYGCTALTSITVPNSVTNIGNYAFYGCSGIEEITLPFVGSSRNASETYDAVFGYIFGNKSSYSTGTTTQYYKATSDGLGFNYYYIPNSLKKVTITDATQIPYGAFYNCNNIMDITLSDDVTSIASHAFYGCTNLTKIMIGTDVSIIGAWAFSKCTTLTSIAISDGVISIGDSAFYGCTTLTSIAIPDSVTSVGESAFSGCTALTSAEIGSGLTSISSRMFYNCTELTDIKISDNVTSIGDNAFYNIGYYNNEDTWEDNVLYIGKHLIRASTAINGEYTIKEGTLTIYENAFYNCTDLTEITIPDSITRIGENAFYGTGYYNNEDNWDNGVLYIGNYLVKVDSSWTGNFTIKSDTKMNPPLSSRQSK